MAQKITSAHFLALLSETEDMFAKRFTLICLLATVFVSTSFGQNGGGPPGNAAPAAPARCAADDGNFLPTATSCSDEIEGCDAVFKTAATANTRDPMCDLEALAD
uniref:Secreted protein n=1 Tax=Steinernema glaseri TaxID=37863 RepID=A0A1I7YQJ8_9BILA